MRSIRPRIIFILRPFDDGVDIFTFLRKHSSYLNLGSLDERLRASASDDGLDFVCTDFSTVEKCVYY